MKVRFFDNPAFDTKPLVDRLLFVQSCLHTIITSAADKNVYHGGFYLCLAQMNAAISLIERKHGELHLEYEERKNILKILNITYDVVAAFFLGKDIAEFDAKITL